MADMLITPAELASYLQRAPDNQPTAELLITAATGAVQAECRQRLVAVAGETINLLGDAGQWLDLPERPVSAVASVQIAAVTVTDWTLYPDPRTGQGRLWRSRGWQTYAGSTSTWYAPPKVTVTYSHGWPAGDPALELARSAVLSLAAAAFGNPDRLQSEQIDDYAVRWAAGGDAGPGVLGEGVKQALRRRYGVTAGSTKLART